MPTSKRRVDRRIQRTHQLLQQAFIELVQEKGFAATSIQDITERANVNRGTFYIHYTDKYVLLDTVMREQFQLQLASRLPSTPRWDKESFYLLIQATLECFEGKYRHQRPRLPVPIPLLEQAIHEELTQLLLVWLKQEKSEVRRWPVPLETIASIVSWTIFGAAVQWGQEEKTVSSEQMANAILLLVTEGATRLVPDTLPG